MDQEPLIPPATMGFSPILGPAAIPEATAAAPSTNASILPTSHFEDIRLEHSGVQIIASSQEQTLNVKTVFAGAFSAQFLGTTHDEPLLEIAKAFAERQTGQPDGSGPKNPGQTSSGTNKGLGRTLGTIKTFSAEER
jgi:hypothetical protein